MVTQQTTVEAALEQALARMRELEDALGAEQQRFASLVDDLAYAYFSCDLLGTVTHANRRAEALTGFRVDQHPSFLEIIHPEDLERAAADLALVATAPNAGPREYRIRRADGVERRVEINTVALRWGEELVGFQGTARDVTEERSAEAALRESEQRFRELAEMLPGVIYEHDLTGRITYSNRHGLELMGYPASDLERDPSMLELIAPEQHATALENLLRLARGEGPLRAEYDLVRRDGTRIPVEVTSTAIWRDGAIVGVRGVLHDLSALRAAAEDQRRLETQVQHAQKLESLGILAGGVAHDFNNLLQVILGNVSLALTRREEDASCRPRLEAIRLAALHAKDLTGQMLAYTGGGPVVVGPVDLNHTVTDLVDLVNASLPKPVQLVLDLAAETPWIEAEATQIQQVLLNLVTNAREAIGGLPGRVTIRTGTVAVRIQEPAGGALGADLPPGDYAVLEVIDSGCGMDAATVRRVFDPFFSTKFPGRGLGLAAAFGIVRGHHGAIRVRSAPGQGSTFSVLLPRCAPLPSREVRALTRPLLRTPGGTVLLVDDEAAVLESSTLILQEAGYTVLTATDGDRALEMFARHGVDITGVLLDLSMPRRDGLETLRQLRQIAPRLPVVLCSGFGEQDVADRFHGLRVDGFLKKPYEMADLLRILQRVLGRRDSAPG